MPAPSSECQNPEAWPASTYGHLRGVSLTFQDSSGKKAETAENTETAKIAETIETIELLNC